MFDGLLQKVAKKYNQKKTLRKQKVPRHVRTIPFDLTEKLANVLKLNPVFIRYQCKEKNYLNKEKNFDLLFNDLHSDKIRPDNSKTFKTVIAVFKTNL